MKVYKAFSQVPALFKSISLFLWQSVVPMIVIYNLLAFRKFALIKTKTYIDVMKRRIAYYQKNLKLRNNTVDVSTTQTYPQDNCTNIDEKIERRPKLIYVSPTQTHPQDICTNIEEKIERGPELIF